jgi:ABC-2 type transport system permease protein
MPRLIGRSVNKPAALVDKAGIVDLEFATSQATQREAIRTTPTGPANIGPPPPLQPFTDTDAALAALKSEEVSAVWVIEADYLTTGNITAYSQNVGVMNQGGANQRQNQVADAIRSSLMKQGLSGDALMRAYAPAVRVKTLSVGRDGTLTDASDASGIGRFLGTFGVFMLFTMAIFFSAGFLQQATIEDRQNRVFEILLSSVDADHLLMGKILGLGAAGLLQVVFYVALIIIPGSSLLSMFQVPLDKVFIAMIYFVIGYLLFACLMAAVGMMSRTPQEAAQLSAVWTLAAAAPMFFMPVLMAAPNGWLARGLSMFPLTSPITMMFRLTMVPNVPTIDIVLSILIGVAAVYFSLHGAARIFRAATLMYGKRPTLPELMRWLRA